MPVLVLLFTLKRIHRVDSQVTADISSNLSTVSGLLSIVKDILLSALCFCCFSCPTELQFAGSFGGISALIAVFNCFLDALV